MNFSDVDRAALMAAIKRLEEPGFADKMTTLAGWPVELAARALPRPAGAIVAKAAEAALKRALDIALFSLRDRCREDHAFSVGLSFGSGGWRLLSRCAAR